MSNINESAREAADKLFEAEAPAEEAYNDSTPVTIEGLTRGDAYHLRALVRMGLQDIEQQLQMAAMFGQEVPDVFADSANNTFEQSVRIDEVLAPLADTADYPRAEEAEPALV